MAHHRMGRHRAEMAQAAIRSDRGGGTMTVNGSEAVCIEGLNSLKLTNCDLYNYLSNFPHFIGFPACPLVK